MIPDFVVDLLAIWGMSEIVGTAIIPFLRQRHNPKTKTKGDRGSRAIFYLAFLPAIYISLYFASYEIGLLPELFIELGILVTLAGIVLRQWSIWILGRFFSPNVRIITGQKIVREGPYRILRHPAYTGFLMIFIGLGLALRTWVGTLVNIILLTAAIYYRIRVEENAMKKEFGDEYVEYSRKTKRLIPYLF